MKVRRAPLDRHLPGDLFWGALLVAAIILAYHTVWRAGFIWDDDLHLTKNPAIIGPLGFSSIWLTSLATYYPLTLTTFWIEHALWGLDPAPYHAVNVLIHAGCAILLWRVLATLRVPAPWLGAALWALHPVQVESVAWITELKNTQSCLFYLLSILFFVKWHQSQGADVWKYVAALLCALLSILSKSSTAMLPVVLGLCMWWMDGRWRRRDIFTIVPFALISAAAGAWTIWEQKFHAGAIGAQWAQTWPERFIIAGRDIWFYLAKLAWPHPLVFHYPRWNIDATQPLMYMSILAALAMMLILWRGRNGRMGPLFFAAAYFVVSLFPVLGFFNVYFFRYSFVGDHFQYLASMGPLALAAAGITALSGLLEKRNAILQSTLVGALLLGLALLSWRQCAMYTDVESLWRTTIARNPGSWFAHNNLGAVLLQQGRIDEAFVHLQKAVEINPAAAETESGVAAVYLKMGRTEETVLHAERALALDPNDPDAHGYLGAALLQMGRVNDAVAYLQKTLALAPSYAEAHSNLGNALLQLGRLDESFAHLQQALEISPNDPAAHFNLAITLLKMNRPDEALAHLQKVVAMDPNDAEAQNNIAWVLGTWSDARIRDGAKAVALAQRADELSAHRNPVFIATLAAAFAESGRFPEAISTAQEALRLAGNDPLAEEIRAQLALYQSGQAFHTRP